MSKEPEVSKPTLAHSKSLRARVGRFWRSSFYEKVESMAEFYWLLKTRLYYRRFFGRIGSHSRILNPMRLSNSQHIFIGDEVIINKCAFLLTQQLNEMPSPQLFIGDGCVIGHMNHITCVNDVYLGKKVLTADRVHISDNSHVFTDPKVAIVDQGVISRGRVTIGDGTWIGENASLLSCRIGKNCVIGANAVVVGDIPDFSVAVGIPARVIRKYDPASGEWKKVEHEDREMTTSLKIREI